VTVYSVLLAGFAVLLARLSGHREFAVGIPFASQARTGCGALIGDGVNTLPLRLQVEADASFEQLVKECHAALLDAADNQDLTTYTLLGALAREPRDSHGALSDVIFNLNPRVPPLDFGAVDYSVRDCPKAALVKQLFFNLNETADAFTLDVHYRTALFRETTIARWAGYYLRLLEARLLAVARIGHALARQRALDENHLARLAIFVDRAADAARFHVERFDLDFGRGERRIGHNGPGRRGAAAMRGFSSGFRHLRTS